MLPVSWSPYFQVRRIHMSLTELHVGRCFIDFGLLQNFYFGVRLATLTLWTWNTPAGIISSLCAIFTTGLITRKQGLTGILSGRSNVQTVAQGPSNKVIGLKAIWKIRSPWKNMNWNAGGDLARPPTLFGLGVNARQWRVNLLDWLSI